MNYTQFLEEKVKNNHAKLDKLERKDQKSICYMYRSAGISGIAGIGTIISFFSPISTLGAAGLYVGAGLVSTGFLLRSFHLGEKEKYLKKENSDLVKEINAIKVSPMVDEILENQEYDKIDDELLENASKKDVIRLLSSIKENMVDKSKQLVIKK